MSDRIKKLKVKKQDGTFSDYIPIGADAENIDFDNGYNLDQVLGDMDIKNDGNIKQQLTNIRKIATHARMFKPICGNNIYIIRPNYEDAKAVADRYIRQAELVGYDDIILDIHLTGENTYQERLDIIEYMKNKLDNLSISCNTLKIHCDPSRIATLGILEGYKNTIITLLNHFNNISKIWIFNECYNSFIKNNLTDCTTLVQDLKNLGIKVGVPLSGNDWLSYSQGSDNNIFFQALDMIGYNYYPQITVENDRPVPQWKVDECMQDFLENTWLPQDKDVYITEIGIKPWWFYYINPSLYQNYPSMGDRDDEAQRVFYSGILSANFQNKVKGIYFWFADWFTDETCLYLNTFLKGEQYNA